MKIWYDCEFIEYPGHVDLISIGMINEDGEELYCESSEFDESKACDWVVENVIDKLQPASRRMTVDKIKDAILNFVGADTPEWWGYCSGYDHVVLSQIFGTMMDLPKGWPHYTGDLKQTLDQCGWRKDEMIEVDEDEAHNALFDAKWTKELSEKITERLISEGNDA